jgi:UDP-3-O-[3-hydroxymyristoyl] glucosamine N-acyltransferase
MPRHSRSMKNITLQKIAEVTSGQLIGDGSISIARLAHPADIQNAGDLALAMDAKLLPLVKDAGIKTAIVSGNPEDSTFVTNRVIVARPRLAMAQLTELFAEPVAIPAGIHPSAVIEKSARVGKNAAIGPFVYVGEHAVIGDNAQLHAQSYIGPKAVIGDNALIHAGAKIGSGTQIGDNVIIHFNATIGADGFSFVTPQAGSVEQAKSGSGGQVTASNTQLIRIASLAPVIIGNDVEIGANTSIDRGTIASTRIGNGTKIDNQVQIGHNVQVGENCMICGRTGIAGSARIGNRVVLGGAVGVADHVSIGDDSIVMAASGVAGNMPAKAIYGGTPALPRERIMENIFNVGRLKQFYKKIEGLAERLDKLEKND